jgi:hypothetical protein
MCEQRGETVKIARIERAAVVDQQVVDFGAILASGRCCGLAGGQQGCRQEAPYPRQARGGFGLAGHGILSPAAAEIAHSRRRGKQVPKASGTNAAKRRFPAESEAIGGGDERRDRAQIGKIRRVRQVQLRLDHGPVLPRLAAAALVLRLARLPGPGARARRGARGFAAFATEAARDTFENWQSEFLQLLWQVVGLAYFLYLGSPSSKENDDRLEAKVDELLRAQLGAGAEARIAEIDRDYLRHHGHARPVGIMAGNRSSS